MNTITIEKKWSSENLTNRTGGDGPAFKYHSCTYTKQVCRNSLP